MKKEKMEKGAWYVRQRENKKNPSGLCEYYAEMWDGKKLVTMDPEKLKEVWQDVKLFVNGLEVEGARILGDNFKWPDEI